MKAAAAVAVAVANLNSETRISVKYFLNWTIFKRMTYASYFFIFFSVKIFISRFWTKNTRLWSVQIRLYKSKLINLISFLLAIIPCNFISDCKKSSETKEWPTVWLVKTYTHHTRTLIAHIANAIYSSDRNWSNLDQLSTWKSSTEFSINWLFSDWEHFHSNSEGFFKKKNFCTFVTSILR